MAASSAKTPAARAALADEKKLLLEAKKLELELGPERRREAIYAAREVYFNADVEEDEVNTAIELLRDLRAESLDPITVILNSPGGDTFDGFMLYDLFRTYSAAGIKVTTKVYGWAASAGGLISQGGDVRLIAPNAWLMIHEPATIAIWAKANEVKREAKLLEALHDQQCEVFAARSSLTQADIKRRSQDKDWWMRADEAVSFGFFDGVL